MVRGRLRRPRIFLFSCAARRNRERKRKQNESTKHGITHDIRARMTKNDQSTTQTRRIATLLAAGDIDGLRAELVALLEQPGASVGLRALDQAGLLTQIIPELEPARATDQPN